MKRISLTVNGGKYEVLVEPRTQLAEVLRDKLHLTGTHLGCEQGVCGACTVIVDGKPVRSCIAYAGSCDGAVVETVEGLRATRSWTTCVMRSRATTRCNADFARQA